MPRRCAGKEDIFRIDVGEEPGITGAVDHPPSLNQEVEGRRLGADEDGKPNEITIAPMTPHRLDRCFARIEGPP